MQLHGVTDYVLVTFCTFFLVRLPTENSQSEKDHVIHDRILGLFALLMYTCINLTINLLAYQIIGLSIILFLLVYFLFYTSEPLTWLWILWSSEKKKSEENGFRDGDAAAALCANL
jgi:hypothetical protein